MVSHRGEGKKLQAFIIGMESNSLLKSCILVHVSGTCRLLEHFLFILLYELQVAELDAEVFFGREEDGQDQE